MRKALFFYLWICAAACAQTLVTEGEVAHLLVPKGLGELSCHVQPMPPSLDFGFRFRAGYIVRAPLSQYRGKGHWWTIVVRVAPESGGAPAYFLERLSMPEIPETDRLAQAAGGYLLGVGRYHVALALLDDQSRVCRSDWNIEVQPGPENRGVKLAMAPGSIQQQSLSSARTAQAPGAKPLGSLTILLHAAPISLRARTLPSAGGEILLGALSSMLDLAPARSVRLVVFNLDQQKEIYRQDHFTLDQLPAVRQALFDLQLSSVDYRLLGNPTGHLDLLEHLVSEELHAEKPSDAVVFLGPRARTSDKRPFDFGGSRAALPKFFYVEYQVKMGMGMFGMGGDELAGVGTSIANQRQRAAENIGNDSQREVYRSGRLTHRFNRWANGRERAAR